MRQNHTVEPATLSPETDRAVERLTEPHTVVHDGHSVDWPPLLEWISDAVTDKTKRGGAGSGGTGSPINEGALAVLQRIERGTAQLRGWLYLHPRAGSTRADLIEAWKVACDYRAKNELDDAGWEYVTSRLQAWVDDIEGEWEDRVHRMELTVACPRCGERWILEHTTDPHDEPKRRAAVVIEYAEGRAPVAECRAADCDAIWAGWTAVHALGFTIGAERDEAVLAACGITLDFAPTVARDTPM